MRRKKRKMASKKRRETAAQRAERLYIHRERMRKFREDLKKKQRESRGEEEGGAAADPDTTETTAPTPFHPTYGTLENAIIEYCEKQEDTQRNPGREPPPPPPQERSDKATANGHLPGATAVHPRRGRRIRVRKAAFGEGENRTREEERLVALRNRRAARRANETKEQRDTRRQKQRERMRKYRSQMRLVAAALSDPMSDPGLAPSTELPAALLPPKGHVWTYGRGLVPRMDAWNGRDPETTTAVGEPRRRADISPDSSTVPFGFAERSALPRTRAPNVAPISSPKLDVDHSVLEPDVILQERSSAVNIPLKICYSTMTVKHRDDDDDPRPMPVRPQLRKFCCRKTLAKTTVPLEPDITLLEASDGSLVPLAVVQQTHEDFDDMIEIEMESGTSDKQTQTVGPGEAEIDPRIKYLLEENRRLKEEIDALKRHVEFGSCPTAY